MGRVKNTPTPRGTMLGDYIAKAHTPKPAPPSVEDRSASCGAAKSSAGRPQAVKLAKSTLSIARVNQSRSSSAASNKRKSAAIDDATESTRTNSAKMLTLRSSKNTASNAQDSNVGATSLSEAQSTKRQKIEEPVRRASRLRKPISGNDSTTTKTAVVTDADKPSRPLRTQRKTAKLLQRAKDEDQAQRQKEAIDLLQGPKINDAEPNALPTPPADSGPEAGASAGGDEEQTVHAYDLLPPGRSGLAPDPTLQIGSSEAQFGAEIAHIRQELHNGDPTTDFSPQSYKAGSPIYDQNFVYRVQPAEGTEMINGSKEDRTGGGGGDSNSATSGDSGYITAPAQSYPPLPLPPMQPSYHANYAPFGPQSAPMMQNGVPSGPMPMHGWPTQGPSPWTVPDMATHTFIISTKGQKVKGRPVQRAPRLSNAAPRTRNVANTYPRKQPFKAQINFDGYPAEHDPLRADATLWEICQDFPNHLIGDTLKAFIQKEWSANELCACLKDDARKVLTDRPGKDKTMVFQKRLERVKKDLIAQGEYDRLVDGPELRPDGRPSWVKRGNVRRK